MRSNAFIGRRKEGRESVVEIRRVANNDSQEAAWRKTLSVCDESAQEQRNLSLFPEDRSIPVDAIDSIQVPLSGMELPRERPYGNCWLATEVGISWN